MSAVDWKSINNEIISKTDIKAECEHLGVRFTGDKPGDGGFIPCHAVDREDVRPSAGVNVKTGWYYDHGDKENSCSFFELAARLNPFTDWRNAQQHYAEKANVELPKARKKSASDFDWSNIVATYDYCDESGNVLYQALRDKNKQFSQRTIVDGKPVNTGPKKNGVALVPYQLDKLSKSTDRVFSVEGEKDVKKLVEAGLTATCNIGGAGKWTDELSQYLAGRDVVIIPDNDEAGQKHCDVVGKSLKGHANSIRVLNLPGLPSKGDVSDWLDAGNTVDELKRLADECEEWQELKTEGIGEQFDDPSRLARLFIELNPHMKFWNDFHDFNGVCYERLEEESIRAKLHLFTDSQFCKDFELELKLCAEDDKTPKKRKVTVNLINNIIAAIKAQVLLPKETKMPSWMIESKWRANRCLVAQNGIIPIDSPETILPSTPDFFSVNALPFAYKRTADCPRWFDFLSELWMDDQESILTLQEIMGYLMLPDTSLQKMFMFIGPKRSGKGTISRVIREVVGTANVVAPTLGGLAGPFGLQPLLGKTVAIIGDARLSGRKDSSVIVERILSITGEDLQTVDRKNQTSVTGHMPIRFILNSNELPRLDDASATLPSRMVLLRLRKTFFGREDIKLTEKLLKECPGILNWSIDGLNRLYDRGYFVQPKSSQELLEDMEALSSPMSGFIRDCCETGTGYEVRIKDLYAAFKEWCSDKGRHVSSEQVFGRDIRAAEPSIDVTQQRDCGIRIRKYNNIRLSVD